MTSGFVLGPGEGSAYGFHGSVAVIKASGEDTFGQLGVIESVYPAALSVHEHVHAGEAEMFYRLRREIEVFCGEDRWTVGAGSFVFVPRDRPHGFTVSSAGPARALVITGPSRLAPQIAERGEAGAPRPGMFRPSPRADRREVALAARRAVLDGRALRLPRSVLEGVDLDDDVVHVF